MLKSLRNRLLVYFILLAIAIVCLVFPLGYFHKKALTDIREKVKQYELIYLEFIRDMKHTGDFLSYETSNPDFFITGESQSLKSHEKAGDSIKAVLTILASNGSRFSTSETDIVRELQETYERYCQVLDSLVYYVYKRGYRDFGIEGEMISYIFQAEKNPVVRSNSFELRRNERDYLNRHDPAYIEALHTSADKLIQIISTKESIGKPGNPELITLLNNYKESFNKIVLLDSRLGLHNNSGLKSILIQTGDNMERLLVKAIDNAKTLKRFR